MRPLIYFTCVALMISLFSAAFPVNGEIELYDSVVRLHVLANSDSDEDQALKLKVRDSILGVMEENMENCQTVDSAQKELEKSKSIMIEAAEKCISENGYSYSVDIEFGEENYPERQYENVSLPAGKYYSVRVKIGEGEGKNWWCVLFPPLCLGSAVSNNDEELASVGLSPDEVKILTNSDDAEYEIKFKLLEFFQKTFA